MRNRSLAAAFVAALLLTTVVLPASAQVAGFTDVSPSNVHAPAIVEAAELDIVKGTTSTTFSPERSVTRGQIASMIVRTLDTADIELPPLAGAPDFSDLGPPHGDNVRRLAAARIVTGHDDGTFRPGHSVSREQLASLFVRALSYVSGEAVVPAERGHFTDVSSGVHAANVDAAFENGLLFGRDDGRFMPAASTRRDQAASVIVRFLGEVREDDETPATETFQLTTSVVGSGSVKLSPSGGVYAEGTKVTVEAVPRDGHRFVSWSGARTGTSNPVVVTVDEDISIKATFEAVPDERFDPAAIGGLILALDAGSIDAGHGSALEVWEDTSGSDFHAVDTSGDTAATYLADAGDGHPAVDFDGSWPMELYRNEDVLRDVPGATMIVVNRWREPDPGVQSVVHLANGVDVAEERLRHRSSSGHNWSFDAERVASQGVKITDGPVTTRWEVFVGRADFAGAEMLLRRNGTDARRVVDVWEPGNTPDTASVRGNIGGRYGGSQLYDGQIRTVLVYERALTDREIAYLEQGLAERWDIALP